MFITKKEVKNNILIVKYEFKRILFVIKSMLL